MPIRSVESIDRRGRGDRPVKTSITFGSGFEHYRRFSPLVAMQAAHDRTEARLLTKQLPARWGIGPGGSTVAYVDYNEDSKSDLILGNGVILTAVGDACIELRGSVVWPLEC